MNSRLIPYLPAAPALTEYNHVDIWRGNCLAKIICYVDDLDDRSPKSRFNITCSGEVPYFSVPKMQFCTKTYLKTSCVLFILINQAVSELIMSYYVDLLNSRTGVGWRWSLSWCLLIYRHPSTNSVHYLSLPATSYQRWEFYLFVPVVDHFRSMNTKYSHVIFLHYAFKQRLK